MTRLRPLAALAAGAVLAAPVSPADASAPVGTAAPDRAACGAVRAVAPDRPRDTAPVGRARLLRLAGDLSAAGAGGTDGAGAPRLRARLVRVPVHVHVVLGRHGSGPARERVRRQLRVLSRAYAGGQSSRSARSPYRFHLASFDVTRNERWRRSTLGSRAQDRMRRSLHTGPADGLDLYVTRPAGRGSMDRVLGFATPPWRVADHPRLDGVTVHVGTLPGGSLRRFGDGDTAVHEVGHWLGLLHPFQGGCGEPNDLVADTPEEAAPAASCDPTTDSCDSPGRDPVRNFMEYGSDACANRFTRGQVRLMRDSWQLYRAA